MATIKKYNGSTWENTTARKYETKSEIITPPTTIYTDGTAITSYTIKGNTVQNGTPTPSAPIVVQGVGELDSGQYKIPISSGGVTTNIYLGSTQTTRQIKKYEFTGNEDFFSNHLEKNLFYLTFAISDALSLISGNITTLSTHYVAQSNTTFQYVSSNGICFFYDGSASNRILFIRDTRFSTIDAFKAFLAEQYAMGTPVTLWYVLQTAQTTAVNEPLMKVDDYADTLSNAASIPTTEGANTITVDTTVQPSEFSATWTGWHDSSVKEWDGSQWD